MSNSGKILGEKGLKMGKRTLKVILLCCTMFMALLLVVSACGGYVNPNSFSFLSVLTLALPLILIINLVIMIAWLVVLLLRFLCWCL